MKKYLPVLGLLLCSPCWATITAGTQTECDSASTCTSATVSVGDILFAFNNDESFNGAAITISSGCTSLATFTRTQSSTSGGGEASGLICQATATAPVFSHSGTCTNFCGFNVQPFHSTIGWDTTTALVNELAATDGTTVTAASLTTTATTSTVVSGYFFQGNGGAVNSAVSPWTLGHVNNGWVDGAAYQLNVSAASYAPKVNTTSAGVTWVTFTGSISESGGGGSTPTCTISLMGAGPC